MKLAFVSCYWEIKWFVNLFVSPCMFICNSTGRIREMFVCIFVVLANANILPNRISERPQNIDGKCKHCPLFPDVCV